jgi:fructokinase
MSGAAPFRIGIDLGGTKTAIAVLDGAGRELFARRVATTHGEYAATIETIAQLVAEAEERLGCAGQASIGVGMPGSIAPYSGKVQNANSIWLNGQDLAADLTARLDRPVRFANDANCFALSEASDGSGQGARSVFGVILGTGCGGGLVYEGRLIDGPRGIAGEWGHIPLPWPGAGDEPQPCWCGLKGCMETWVSGPALYRDYLARGGSTSSAADATAVGRLAETGDDAAAAALDRHASRLGRGLAMVINIFDPEVIVLGGGLSNLTSLYARLPQLIAPYLFADDRRVDIRRPHHGDASGVRGAARLWDSA